MRLIAILVAVAACGGCVTARVTAYCEPSYGLALVHPERWESGPGFKCGMKGEVELWQRRK